MSKRRAALAALISHPKILTKITIGIQELLGTHGLLPILRVQVVQSGAVQASVGFRRSLSLEVRKKQHFLDGQLTILYSTLPLADLTNRHKLLPTSRA
jgi:hypothetical protein